MHKIRERREWVANNKTIAAVWLTDKFGRCMQTAHMRRNKDFRFCHIKPENEIFMFLLYAAKLCTFCMVCRNRNSFESHWFYAVCTAADVAELDWRIERFLNIQMNKIYKNFLCVWSGWAIMRRKWNITFFFHWNISIRFQRNSTQSHSIFFVHLFF